MTVLLIALGVLLAVAVTWSAALFLLWAIGRISVDLGWGRGLHALGPIEIAIAAPRETVAEMIAAPYLGRAPAAGVEVLSRGEGLVVASHLSKVHFYESRTIEAVEIDSPERFGFRHLHGPVPHAVEEFRLSENDGTTTLVYDGELGIDFWLLGRIAGRLWVVPQWEGIVREHLEDLKRRAEERAERAKRRERPV